MEAIKEQLGKVAITVEKDYWSNTRAYDRLVIVEVKGAFRTFISRKPVPAGTDIFNREYWIPFSSLQEELVSEYNAWINKYSELLEEAEGQSGPSNTPAQPFPTYVDYSELHKQEVYNKVNLFTLTRSNCIVVAVKAVNCTLNIEGDFLNNPRLYEVFSTSPRVLYKLTYQEQSVEGLDNVEESFLIFHSISNSSNRNFEGSFVANRGYYFDSVILHNTPYYKNGMYGTEDNFDINDRTNPIQLDFDFTSITSGSFLYVRAAKLIDDGADI